MWISALVDGRFRTTGSFSEEATCVASRAKGRQVSSTPRVTEADLPTRARLHLQRCFVDLLRREEACTLLMEVAHPSSADPPLLTCC